MIRPRSIALGVLMTLGCLYAAAFVAYVATLALCPDAVTGPHSWEWLGRDCGDPMGHVMRGTAWDIAGGER